MQLKLELRESDAVPEGMVWIPGRESATCGLVGRFEPLN